MQTSKGRRIASAADEFFKLLPILRQVVRRGIDCLGLGGREYLQSLQHVVGAGPLRLGAQGREAVLRGVQDIRAGAGL